MKRARRSTAYYGDNKWDSKVPRKANVSDGQPGPSTNDTNPDPGANNVVDPFPDTVNATCFLDSLPDHLVVRIFKHLDLPEIALRVPGVCKRWRHLVTSEDLWKDKHLSYDPYMSDSKKTLFYKCFKMAPKLSALTVELDWTDLTEFNSHLKDAIPHEITAMHFIYDNEPPQSMFILLSKYKDCVEKLAITDTYTPYTDSDVKQLWNHIQNLSKVKHLVVDGAALFLCKATFRKNSPCWKSLHILDVQDCSYEDMNTVQRLIAMNPNWTEVYLAKPQSQIFRAEVKALARCLKLDSVQVPFCKEIKLLERCDKLDSLIIDCEQETAKEIAQVMSSFSKSTVFPNLKAVKMVGGGSVYTKLLLSLLKGRPGINLLSLVSMDFSSKDMTEILDVASRVESLFLNEMSGLCVSVVKTWHKELLPNLKKVGFVECHCIKKSSICVREAEIQLKNQSRSLEIVSQCSCDCKATNFAFDTNTQGENPNQKTEKKTCETKVLLKGMEVEERVSAEENPSTSDELGNLSVT